VGGLETNLILQVILQVEAGPTKDQLHCLTYISALADGMGQLGRVLLGSDWICSCMKHMLGANRHCQIIMNVVPSMHYHRPPAQVGRSPS
jgi:hypothetical protein